jgi:HAD superfamily hydrolase (TIGR01459 family)
MTAPLPPIVGELGALRDSADAWLCDIWGVMHNGVAPFAGAVEACRRFRAAGGTVILLSNAPRPFDAVDAQLARIGVPRACYDMVVSSGDLTRRLLAERRGARVHHVGPARDLPLLAGLDLTRVGYESADVVLLSGLDDDTRETPDDYLPRLAAMVGRGLPAICANPDLKAERGEKIIYCAGALAVVYEGLGGTVTWCGKPHPPVYELALRTIAQLRGREVPRERVLAIGDGLATDIAGAAVMGLRSVFVASAIHAGEPLSDAVLGRLLAGAAARPVAAMDRLAW